MSLSLRNDAELYRAAITPSIGLERNWKPRVAQDHHDWGASSMPSPDRWNTLLRSVIGTRPNVTLLDLNKKLGPDGYYTNKVDGIKMRMDGVHPTPEAVKWLTPWLADALGSLPGDLADRPLRDDVDIARDLLTRWGERPAT